MSDKTKRGSKPIDPEGARTVQIPFRVQPKLKAAIDKAARKKHVSRNEWILGVIRRVLAGGK